MAIEDYHCRPPREDGELSQSVDRQLFLINSSPPAVNVYRPWLTRWSQCFAAAFALVVLLLFMLPRQFEFFPVSHALHCAIALLCMAIALLCAARVCQEKPWRPFLTVGAEGIFCHRVSHQLIPWSSIAQITVRAMAGRSKRKMIDILISADADPILIRKVTVQSALFTHVPGKPNISIRNCAIVEDEAEDLTGLLLEAFQRHSPSKAAATNIYLLSKYRSRKASEGIHLAKT